MANSSCESNGSSSCRSPSAEPRDQLQAVRGAPQNFGFCPASHQFGATSRRQGRWSPARPSSRRRPRSRRRALPDARASYSTRFGNLGCARPLLQVRRTPSVRRHADGPAVGGIDRHVGEPFRQPPGCSAPYLAVAQAPPGGKKAERGWGVLLRGGFCPPDNGRRLGSSVSSRIRPGSLRANAQRMRLLGESEQRCSTSRQAPSEDGGIPHPGGHGRRPVTAAAVDYSEAPTRVYPATTTRFADRVEHPIFRSMTAGHRSHTSTTGRSRLRRAFTLARSSA